jgi:hypothetical protein
MLSSVKSKMSSAMDKVTPSSNDTYDKLGCGNDTASIISCKEDVPKASTQNMTRVRPSRFYRADHEAMLAYFTTK